MQSKVYRMKQMFSISAVVLSAFLLLTLSALPHHHHRGQVHIAMESCEHEEESQQLPESKHGTCCVAEHEFVLPRSGEEQKCKASPGKAHHHIGLFPIYFIVNDFLYCFTPEIIPKAGFKIPISFYTSAETNRFHGLRAPPLILS